MKYRIASVVAVLSLATGLSACDTFGSQSRGYQAAWEQTELSWNEITLDDGGDYGESAELLCMQYLSESKDEALEGSLRWIAEPPSDSEGQDSDYDTQALLDYMDEKCLEENGQPREYQAAWKATNYIWTEFIETPEDAEYTCLQYLSTPQEEAAQQILGPTDAENPNYDTQALLDYMDEKCRP